MPNYIIYAIDRDIPDQTDEESLALLSGPSDSYWMIPVLDPDWDED